MSECIDDARARYHAAAHAMESGVAAKMGYDPTETTPKRLRTGVNLAVTEQRALVALLLAKGVFTMDEYASTVADAMEDERDMYEKWLRDEVDPRIRLV